MPGYQHCRIRLNVLNPAGKLHVLPAPGRCRHFLAVSRRAQQVDYGVWPTENFMYHVYICNDAHTTEEEEDSIGTSHFDEGSGDTLVEVSIVFFIAVADFFEGFIFYFCLFLPLLSSVFPSVFARPAVLVMGADRKYCIPLRTKCWRSSICSGIGMSYCQEERSLNVSLARTDTVLIACRCHQDCSPLACD